MMLRAFWQLKLHQQVVHRYVAPDKRHVIKCWLLLVTVLVSAPLALVHPASRCYKVCHPSAVVMMVSDWRQGLPGFCLFTYNISVLLLSNHCYFLFLFTEM